MFKPTQSIFAVALGLSLLAGAARAQEPYKLSDLIPEKLVDAKGEEVVASELFKDKAVIGLYFSASWWGGCKKPTSELVKFRKENGEDLEVVLVNYDEDQEGQNAYMKKSKMENPAVPHDAEKNDEIYERIKAAGFPTLVLFDKDGKMLHHVICMDGIHPIKDGKIEEDKVEKDLSLEKFLADTIAAVKPK